VRTAYRIVRVNAAHYDVLARLGANPFTVLMTNKPSLVEAFDYVQELRGKDGFSASDAADLHQAFPAYDSDTNTSATMHSMWPLQVVRAAEWQRSEIAAAQREDAEVVEEYGGEEHWVSGN
jgi:GGDEF domain-containing protein